MIIEKWITVHPNGKENKGQPIPVGEGQSKGDAVKSFVDRHKKDKLEKKYNDDLFVVRKMSSQYLEKAVNRLSVLYNKPKHLSKKKTDEEIIKNVSGGDKTKGSCVSVAFAYVGNKAGLDVLDFRGGDSLSFFSTNKTMQEIAKLKGVKSFIVSDQNNDYKAVSMLVKNVKENREYVLSVGKHAAIIKKENGKYFYLELQSPNYTENGFKPLDNSVLKKRFACKKSNTFYRNKINPVNILIDVETLGKSKEFKLLLGYINTKKEKQQKGVDGSVK